MTAATPLFKKDATTPSAFFCGACRHVAASEAAAEACCGPPICPYCAKPVDATDMVRHYHVECYKTDRAAADERLERRTFANAKQVLRKDHHGLVAAPRWIGDVTLIGDAAYSMDGDCEFWSSVEAFVEACADEDVLAEMPAYLYAAYETTRVPDLDAEDVLATLDDAWSGEDVAQFDHASLQTALDAWTATQKPVKYFWEDQRTVVILAPDRLPAPPQSEDAQ